MKQPIVCTLVICTALAGCATETPVVKGSDKGVIVENTAFIGINWMLTEIRNGDVLTILDRQEFTTEGMENFFCLRFDVIDGEHRLFGTAAPNHYNAPYTLSDDNILTIGLMISTKMAAFRKPKALTEQEFFDYLYRITRLNVSNEGCLELTTTTKDGSLATLIFSPFTTVEKTIEATDQIQRAP